MTDYCVELIKSILVMQPATKNDDVGRLNYYLPEISHRGN